MLLPLDWIIKGGFFKVLFKCLMICPGIPQLLGFVFESRWVPWSPRYQFSAFMPGNPALAVFVAGCSTTIGQPSSMSQQQSMRFNKAALAGSFVAYALLNIMDLKSNYTREQMLSATKQYHNSLYFWYGYLTVALAGHMFTSGISWRRKLLILVPGLCWLACLVADNLTSKETLVVRFQTAHTDNAPIWRTRRLRRLHLIVRRNGIDYTYA